jgi:hypothetical protein
MVIFRPIQYAFRELIYSRRHQIPFWVLLGFLPTYAVARYLVHHNPNLFLNVHHVHVHHFTYGFFVLAIVGFISLQTTRWRNLQAALYGFGLALAFDEFGMWVRLADNYSIRASQNAMIAILVILIILVYGIGVARRAAPHAKRLNRRHR